eukprot:2774756-Prymnesium_polylepis.1
MPLLVLSFNVKIRSLLTCIRISIEQCVMGPGKTPHARPHAHQRVGSPGDEDQCAPCSTQLSASPHPTAFGHASSSSASSFTDVLQRCGLRVDPAGNHEAGRCSFVTFVMCDDAALTRPVGRGAAARRTHACPSIGWYRPLAERRE